MKKMFVSSLAAIFLALLIPGLALALDPPSPNILGLYEFSDGTGATGSSEIGTPVTVYLVLNNPADEQNGDAPYPSINAFECMLSFNPPGNLFLLSAQLPPGAGDDFEPQDIGSGFLEYTVGLASNYAVTDASVVLITFSFMHTSPGNIQVGLGPTTNSAIPGEMAFQSVVGDLRVMHPYDNPLFDGFQFLFGRIGLAVENESFGSVKALYR